jgi:hypothetical protein
MKSISITIPHDLGSAGAKARIQGGMGQMRGQFTAVGIKDFEEFWEDDRVSFRARGMGQSIEGRIDIRDKDVRIEVDLPWMLAALADKIKGGVERQGKLMLERKPANS